MFLATLLSSSKNQHLLGNSSSIEDKIPCVEKSFIEVSLDLSSRVSGASSNSKTYLEKEINSSPSKTEIEAHSSPKIILCYARKSRKEMIASQSS